MRKFNTSNWQNNLARVLLPCWQLGKLNSPFVSVCPSDLLIKGTKKGAREQYKIVQHCWFLLYLTNFYCFPQYKRKSHILIDRDRKDMTDI